MVATVNGTKIFDMEYGRLYRQQLRVEEQRAQRSLSDPEQKSLGERVRQSLIEGQVLVQEANRLGLHVSDSEVALQLMQIPGLRDGDGKYSEEKYRQFLKRNQYTKSDFEESLRSELLRAKLQQLVYTGASLSEHSDARTPRSLCPAHLTCGHGCGYSDEPLGWEAEGANRRL